jgi:hypothetical protein
MQKADELSAILRVRKYKNIDILFHGFSSLRFLQNTKITIQTNKYESRQQTQMSLLCIDKKNKSRKGNYR